MPGPIKPKEVTKKKTGTIPEEVFEAFNDLIVQEWDGHSASIALSTVAEWAIKKLKEKPEYKKLTRQAMYDKGWMDIEDSYRKAGWDVDFDKPGWDESYEAHFTFTKK